MQGPSYSTMDGKRNGPVTLVNSLNGFYSCFGPPSFDGPLETNTRRRNSSLSRKINGPTVIMSQNCYNRKLIRPSVSTENKSADHSTHITTRNINVFDISKSIKSPKKTMHKPSSYPTPFSYPVPTKPSFFERRSGKDTLGRSDYLRLPTANHRPILSPVRERKNGLCERDERERRVIREKVLATCRQEYIEHYGLC